MGSRESIAAVIGLRGLPETSRRANTTTQLCLVNTNTITSTEIQMTTAQNIPITILIKDIDRQKKSA